MKYRKKKKWLSCDNSHCRRKACNHPLKTNCLKESHACKKAKFNILPVNPTSRSEEITNNAQVHIASSELFSGMTLHCAQQKNGACHFATCVSGEVCTNNTFTVLRKENNVEGAVINQNDKISLCQKESETNNQYCLSCSKIPGWNRKVRGAPPCRLVSCPDDLTGCTGIFFNARQWPSTQ